MRSRIAALALTMSLGFAAPASASTQFTFVNPGTVTAFGYYVGQYHGTEGAPVNASVVLNCVDFFHHIQNGEIWQANLTSLGSTTGIGTTTRFNNLTLYREAAWLTTQYAAQYAASNTAAIGQIQATIWSLFSGPTTPPHPSSSVWLNAAQTYVSAHPGTFQNFWVVSDVRTHGVDDAISAQEFIIYDDKFNPNVVPTPEPATLMLVATGIAGIAGVRIRRRKK